MHGFPPRDNPHSLPFLTPLPELLFTGEQATPLTPPEFQIPANNINSNMITMRGLGSKTPPPEPPPAQRQAPWFLLPSRNSSALGKLVSLCRRISLFRETLTCPVTSPTCAAGLRPREAGPGPHGYFKHSSVSGTPILEEAWGDGRAPPVHESRARVSGRGGSGGGCSSELAGVPCRGGGTPGASSLPRVGQPRRAALTVFMMKGELQWVLQQGPEHTVGRRDEGGIQGKRSGHFLHRVENIFLLKKSKKKKKTTTLQNVAEVFPPSFAKSTRLETREKKITSIFINTSA